MKATNALGPALLFLAIATACSEPEAAPPAGGELPTVGAFTVLLGDGGLTVASAADPGRILLDSFLGGSGQYAPLAVRHAEAAWEERYGAFKIEDGPEPWRGAASLTAVEAPAGEVHGEFRDAAGAVLATLTATSPAEGVLSLELRAAATAMNRLSLAFGCTAEDRFLGFGAQADRLDHRGEKVPIWTSEPGIGKTDSDDPGDLWMLVGARHASSLGLPVWLSQRGYLGVLRSDRRSLFELCSARPDAWRMEVWDSTLTLLVHDGPTPAAALERATAGVLGRPVRPPPAVFAPWNDGLFGSESIRAVAALIREEHIPSSVIWTEDFRGGEEVEGRGYRLQEEWVVDRTLYPDVELLAAELRDQGFAFLAYFNSFLVEGTGVFAEAEAGGHFVGSPEGGPYLFSGPTFKPTGLADLSRPESREWVKGHMRAALDQGFSGWMADFGEWLPHDAVLASGEDPLEAHNRYPLEWAKLNQEVLAEREAEGRQRLLFLRAGWLGSAAHVPVFWPGDQRTSFLPDDGLPTVIPMQLGAALAGLSTSGSDIGGYQSVSDPPPTKELFFRWTTLGALSPVMRTHHGTKPRESWWFGSDAESIAHFRRWARLHIRLFPYLDGGAAEAEATGLPLMRALPLAFPEDAAGWSVSDEYLLGPSLLVAPVTAEGATGRVVHFPPGRWLPFEGGAFVEGPADLEVAAPLTELPLFARAGAIVPLLPEEVETLLPAEPPVVDLEDVAGRRVVYLVPGAAGSFTERGGITYRLAEAAGAGAAPLEAGLALGSCRSAEERGCVETEAGARRVRLRGSGPMILDGWSLTIEGPPLQFDVVVPAGAGG